MKVGEKFTSDIRIISEDDIRKYDEIRGKAGPMQASDEYARSVGYQRRIVSSGLIFSIVNVLIDAPTRFGSDLKPMAFLGVRDMRFKAPLHPGEGVLVEGELLEKRESKSRGGMIVSYSWQAKKTDGTIIAYGESAELASVEGETRQAGGAD
ncbi:MaoC family dehydratase [Chloroflexota bacterium]